MLSSSVLVAGYNWSSLSAPFEDLATNLIGSPVLIGILVFLFFLLLMLVAKFDFETMVVVLVPVMFIVFFWIEQLRIIIGILLGILIGIGLLKWYRR